MLECWRHSATRRPTFIQLLDQLVPDLPEEFGAVSFYFNHEPDNDDDAAAAADSDSTNSRYASAEDVSETVRFRAESAAQPKSEPSNFTALRNLSDELQSSGFVGQSSAERNPRSAEFIEMSRQPNVTTAGAGQSSIQPDEDRRSSRQSSRGTVAACRTDVHGLGDSGSKGSSGSSQGSRKNGLINGCVIPFGSALSSDVH